MESCNTTRRGADAQPRDGAFATIRKVFGLLLRRLRGGQSGTSAVEFALVAPVVIALMVGSFEVCNGLSVWLTLKKASEVGARYATTGQGEQDGTRLAKIIASAQSVITKSRNIPVTITVQSWQGMYPNGAGRANNPGTPCDCVEVRIAHAYQPITPLGALLGLLGGGASAWSAPVQMSGSTRMVNEPWQPCP